MFGWCVHGSIAASVNTDAACQIIKLKNKGSFGKQESMGAVSFCRGMGLACLGRRETEKAQKMLFLPGWHRVEITNNDPSEDICSADRTHPWDRPHGPLWLLQMSVL